MEPGLEPYRRRLPRIEYQYCDLSHLLGAQHESFSMRIPRVIERYIYSHRHYSGILTGPKRTHCPQLGK
jgi:hypothetical protein